MTISRSAPASNVGAGEIRLENVSVSFGGAPVVAGVDLTVAAGEFVCLLGPSGCGKVDAAESSMAGFFPPNRRAKSLRRWRADAGSRAPIGRGLPEYGVRCFPWMTVARMSHTVRACAARAPVLR